MPTDRLWTNDDNGQISCQRHAGGYLTQAIAAAPAARSHWTPLGTWRLWTEADDAEWRESFGHSARCETCNYNSAPGSALVTCEICQENSCTEAEMICDACAGRIGRNARDAQKGADR